jgi:hypothetical protein
MTFKDYFLITCGVLCTFAAIALAVYTVGGGIF